jgi:hypothetical protein
MRVKELDNSVAALVASFCTNRKLEKEINRLLDSGSVDPTTVRLSVLLKVGLENLASEINTPIGSSAYEQYVSLRRV